MKALKFRRIPFDDICLFWQVNSNSFYSPAYPMSKGKVLESIQELNMLDRYFLHDLYDSRYKHESGAFGACYCFVSTIQKKCLIPSILNSPPSFIFMKNLREIGLAVRAGWPRVRMRKPQNSAYFVCEKWQKYIGICVQMTKISFF